MAYKISEFSKISGVPAPNIRFYEQKGYPQPERRDNGYRQYCLEDVYRINTFNMLMAQGFSVTEAIKRLEYHEAEDYCRALQDNNERMQETIWLLEKKMEWNRKMQYVYANLEYEFSIGREIMLPEMCFLKCSDNTDLQESYMISEQISEWLKLLPFSHYAEKRLNFQQFELGMLLEKSVADKYKLADDEMPVLHQGKYYCMLVMDSINSEEDLLNDRRIAGYLEKGGKIKWPVYSVYLMVGEKQYGEFMNYILIEM